MAALETFVFGPYDSIHAVNNSQAKNCSEDTFGPASCRNDFDFTLLFEQSILWLVPSILFIFLASWRLWCLKTASRKVHDDPMSMVKITTAIAFAGIQLTVLIFWRTRLESATRVTLAAAAFSFIASVFVVALSTLEHARSYRPSGLLVAYLLLTTLFEAAQVRTLFLTQSVHGLPGSMTASLGLRVMLLLLEVQTKRRYLRAPYSNLSKETTSGALDWSLFFWINNLFRNGFRKVLTYDDLDAIDEELKSEPLRERVLRAWDTRSKPEGRFTLSYALIRCLRKELLVVCLPRLLLIAVTYTQPFLIQRAVSFFGEPESPESRNVGYGLIAATLVIYTLRAFLNVQYNQRFTKVVTQFRGAVISLVYEKTLNTKEGASPESAAVTLISSDVITCVNTLPNLNEVWASAIEVIVGLALLARQMGALCVIPIALYGASSFAQGKISVKFATVVREWNASTQTRLSLTGTALTSIKALRMTGLAAPVKDKLAMQRDTEIKTSMGQRYIVLLLNVIVGLGECFVPLVVFGTYEIIAKVAGTSSLDTTKTLVTLSILQLLINPSAILLISLPLSAGMLGALGRIQDYLLLPSVSTGHDSIAPNHAESFAAETSDIELATVVPKPYKNHVDAAIRLENVTVKYTAESTPAMKDFTCSFARGSLNMIIGPVGSGKTTLLKAILQEVPVAGSISRHSARVAFATQSAWLPNASVQSLICGMRTKDLIDERFYSQVLYACALNEDLKQLSDGDRTIIGSRGITLSGGQRQRISLARAVYAREDIILLDDILSALDTSTEQLVVSRLLGKQGLLRKLGTTILLVTHSVRLLPLADTIYVLGGGGTLAAQGNLQVLQQHGHLSQDILTQIKEKEDPHSVEAADQPKTVPGSITNEQKEDLSRKAGDFSIYSYYARSIGWKPIAVFIACNACGAFMASFGQVWLQWLSKANGHRIAFWMTGYAIIATSNFLLNIGALWVALVPIYSASARSLHSTLLNTVFHAKQSFHNSTDTGITLNRFSQDLIVVDKELITAILTCGIDFFMSLAALALVFASSTYMACVLPLLVLVLYTLQDVYLKTSRQLRFHELESVSPLYTHLLETLEGLPIIRAFGWQEAATQMNLARLDRSQKCFYLLQSVQKWLAMALDLMVLVLATILMTLAIQLRSSSSAGLLGLALINVISLTDSLSKFIVAFTQLETSLGAIARIKKFATEVEPENKLEENVTPPADWPTSGRLDFESLSASYDNTSGSESALALDSINLSILPGQKVGICGRTGSGKSTLLATLLRLVEISSGSIMIDGVDISTVPRALLRSRFAAIPQDSFILSGSVRTNADPTNESTDAEIVTTLEKVGLWAVITARGGLDGTLLEQPLSQGQQQLFGLARAMLRGKRSKVLILDEATSNADRETDRAMQKIIRQEFAQHTILTVAHRLDTIMDSDVVVVLDKGKTIEMGKPEELLKKKGGVFRELAGV